MIMDIAEIKRRVDLLKMANNKKYCLIPELAKELKVSKTDLMQFILDNPKLFHTDNQWTYKVMLRSQKVAPNKNLGLGIEEVYILPEDNFRTEEWLQKQKVEKARYIQRNRLAFIFIFLNLITMAYRDIMLALIKKVILNIENGFGVTLYLK